MEEEALFTSQGTVPSFILVPSWQGEAPGLTAETSTGPLLRQDPA